jgi:hypothetical protein
MENARTKIPGQGHVVGKHVKKKIRLFCIHEGIERTRDDVRHENVYYECIYDIPGTRHLYLTILKLKLPKYIASVFCSCP